MAHPQMFSDDDPGLREFRAICLGFPGASEKVSHGRPTFRTKKLFAAWGGLLKGGTEAEVQRPFSVLVKADADTARRLLEDPRFYLPAYYGPSGWVGLDLTAAPVDWEEVRELVEDSFRLTAPRSLVAQLP